MNLFLSLSRNVESDSGSDVTQTQVSDTLFCYILKVVYLSQVQEIMMEKHKHIQNHLSPHMLSEPAPNYLQVLWDENLPSFLDHGLWFQLLGRELAFAWVEHLLARHAGQSQVGRVGLVSHRDLDGVWIDGTGSVPGVREAWRKTSRVFNDLCQIPEDLSRVHHTNLIWSN